MDLRLKNLEALDARAVPLPAGTEVITRVDRAAADKRAPQGSVGRVMRASGEQVDVSILGFGVLRYARDELSPRRVGQALFTRLDAARDASPLPEDPPNTEEIRAWLIDVRRRALKAPRRA